MDSLDTADLARMKAIYYHAKDTSLNLGIPQYHVITYESLLSDWKAYKAECWNDSSKNMMPTICYPSDPPSFGGYVFRGWNHREPTLDGFMEWLMKKYKGEN
jgi:hypothetical protein